MAAAFSSFFGGERESARVEERSSSVITRSVGPLSEYSSIKGSYRRKRMHFTSCCHGTAGQFKFLLSSSSFPLCPVSVWPTLRYIDRLAR